MKKSKINTISRILIIINVFLIAVIIFLKNNFELLSFEQILYNISNSEGTSKSIIIKGIIFILITMIIIFIFLYLVKYCYKKFLYNKYYLKIIIKRKEHILKLFSINKVINLIIIIVINIVIIYNILDIFGILTFLKEYKDSSTIIEDNYINAKDVNIEFPKNKQNLIFIFVESMETSAVSRKNGGISEESFIPHLEDLALNNINFSNTDNLGGAHQAANAQWTIAGMIAQTAGLPLKTIIGYNEYKGYHGSLPGAYNLGDILKANGYNNYIMMGSDSSFGGRYDYFTQHGDYEVYDYNWAKEEQYIDEDYYEWWGFEDKKLFSFARKEITKISSENKPFNFTLLTADTHFTDGYQDETCKKVYKDPYANCHICSDSMIYDFVKWIEKQSFYKDTTIIITGDHLTMQYLFYKDIDAEYDRTIYNVFINSRQKSSNTKNRQFTSFDIFPTTLASLGCGIEGNKLGLGTNLFSNEKTLTEKYELDYVNSELEKKSLFYNNNILKNTYYEMKNQKTQD